MKSREILSQKYAVKCQRLGALLLDKEKLDESIMALKAEIRDLNAALPICEEIEAAVTVRTPEVVSE